MRDDADRVVVHLVRVHLLAEDLWGHVPRRATRVQRLLRVLGAGYAEVGQSKVA